MIVAGYARVWAAVAAAAVAAAGAQQPSPEEQDRAIERARQTAIHYSQALPDFMCTEVVRRFVESIRRGGMRSLDELTIQLGYSGQREQYRLLLVDGKPSEATFESLYGATSKGEFGGALQLIFDKVSKAEFVWRGAATVRKQRVWTYGYRVPKATSRYYLETRTSGNDATVIVGYHGVVEIVPDGGETLHLSYEAEDIPKVFPVRGASTKVDYAPADVGGRQYLLPAKAVVEMRDPQGATRNEVQFRDYRKFTADSNVTFK